MREGLGSSLPLPSLGSVEDRGRAREYHGLLMVCSVAPCHSRGWSSWVTGFLLQHKTSMLWIWLILRNSVLQHKHCSLLTVCSCLSTFYVQDARHTKYVLRSKTSSCKFRVSFFFSDAPSRLLFLRHRIMLSYSVKQMASLLWGHLSD